jgi:hypothetical protein
MSTTVKNSGQFPESSAARTGRVKPPELESTILDQLPAFIFLVADDYSIKYTNSAFIRQFGSTETSGLCHALIRAQAEPCADCPLTNLFRDRQKQVYIYEDTIRGQIYEFSYSPYLSDSGRKAVLVFGIDITEKYREKNPLKKKICTEHIVHICSHCKSIRTKFGIWQKIESYMRSQSDIQFSHGICPLCMQKHHPDIK